MYTLDVFKVELHFKLSMAFIERMKIVNEGRSQILRTIHTYTQ